MKHVVLGSAVLALLASPASALVITFDAVLTNQLTESDPTTAFPNQDDVEVDLLDNGGETQALVDFLDFAIPVGATVNSATLNFYTNSATDGGIGVHQLLVPFSETSTWDGFGGGIDPLTQIDPVPADVLIAPGDEQPHSFDVTSIVQNWVAGDDQFGFALFNDSTDGWDFDGADFDGFGPRFGPNLQVDFELPETVTLTDPTTTQLTEAAPDTAFPNLDDVTVDLSSGGGETQALVRFDDVALPPGTRLTSATLQFFTNDETISAITVHQLLQAFDETTTWNSFGLDGLSLDDVEAVSDPAAFAVEILSDRPQSFDVTEIVQAWLDGAPNEGFAFLADFDDGWDFDGTDVDGDGPSFAPSLTLAFAPAVVPLPSSAFLLLGGLAGFACLRRRGAA